MRAPAESGSIPPRMRVSSHLIALASLAVLGCNLLACSMPKPNSPKAGSSEMSRIFTSAFEREMTEPLDDTPYLDAIDRAVRSPDEPDSLAVVSASLEALVFHNSAPARVGPPVAYRSREAMGRTVLRLRQSWDALEGAEAKQSPFMREFIARALHQLALFSGEGRGATVWGERRACARQATVVGPVDWTPLSATDQPSPVASEGRFEASYGGVGHFKKMAVPTLVDADACMIDTHVTSSLSGVFDVVVDVDNPHEQLLSFVVTSNSTSSLRVGGRPVVSRRFEAGGQALTVMGQARVSEGVARIIVRVGDRSDAGPIELDILGEDGMPLRMKAPRPGDVAKARASAANEVTIHAGPGLEGRTLEAAALLGVGDPRRAEHAIESEIASGNATLTPPLQVLYSRAMELAGDMPEARRIERSRSAVEAVLKAVPRSWEARLAKAELTERSKGYGDGVFAALGDLGVTRPDPDLSLLTPTELARVIEMTDRAGLNDLSEKVYAELEKRSAGSPMLAQADASLHRRVGRDEVQVACNGGLGRDSSGCVSALMSVGNRKAALAEISRLRKLRASPRAFEELELQIAIADGDKARALAIYDGMLPGRRPLLTILPLLSGEADRVTARSLVARDVTTSRDGISVLPKLGVILDQPSEDARRYEDEGRKIVEADRKTPALPGAATAVLRHVEHYGLDDSGLLHVFSYDLRRVSGTTDVEQGINIPGPSVEGRGNDFILRRRIHKKDGRVLEPDAADRAQQGASDLSQLEQGDYVEMIRTGWFLPSDAGELTIDTPDLLPERTSVKEGEVILRFPERLDPAIWSHAMLGKPETTSKGGYKFLTYHLTNAPARRFEDGVPSLEQGVRISMGTQSWPNVARSIGETIRSLDDHDPFMKRFAAEASKAPEGVPAPPGVSPEAAIVARVVDHVGRTLKIAQGGQLSDMASAYGGGPQSSNARGMIEDRQGSRSWVIFRTLRELGVKVDLAVAETEPFSTLPSFPPHFGRFRYPLVVAHLEEGDEWIDADISGPPLPPGRVSPELRGRSAIFADGKIVSVTSRNDDTFDDVDIALTVDEKGTAKGKVKLTLRGRTAQALSEAFNTVVGSDRTEMLRSVVMGWVPLADIDEVHLSSTEGAWEVSVDADVSIHGFGSPEGRDGHTFVLAGFEPVHSGMGRTGAGTLAQVYATRSARQSALSIESPIQYRVRRKLQLPAGMTIVKGPTNVAVKSPNLVASRTAKVEGSVVSEDFTLSLPTGTVEADRYRAFVDDVQQIDAGFLAGIRVKVK